MNLPIDPDLDAAIDDGPHSQGSPFERDRPVARHQLRWDVILVVFAGGCLGGWARYGITSTWPARSGSFPWSTFEVNIAGAFVLALVIVTATDIAPSRYLRPLIGTGFCGAFTTFSSIVVTTDQLFAHEHPSTAIAYLSASIAGGLLAATVGLVAARAVAARRHRAREERMPS